MFCVSEDYTILPFPSDNNIDIDIKVLSKSITKRKPFNIIFDLDNTLICSVLFSELHLLPKDINLIYKDYIVDKTNSGANYRIFYRPYLINFLKYVSQFFNISVWTAATKLYADFIVENIFPKEIKPEFVFHSMHTEYGLRRYFRFKPLELVYDSYPNEYNKKNTIIIDDLNDVYLANPNNCISIKPFKIFTDRLHIFNTTYESDTSLLDIIPQIKQKFTFLSL